MEDFIIQKKQKIGECFIDALGAAKSVKLL